MEIQGNHAERKQQEVEKGKVLTLLTGFSIFLMGYIDAYTFIAQDGVFASPQTGNLIALTSQLFIGEWYQALKHIFVFFGFMAGAFIGQMIMDRVIGDNWKRHRVSLLLPLALLCFVALIQQLVSPFIIGFLLGFLAGYVLILFRQIHGVTINNGIMTGNVKNLMQYLHDAIFYQNGEARHAFLILLAGIGIFIAGIGAGTLVLEFWGPLPNLWGAFGLTGVVYLWLLGKR